VARGATTCLRLPAPAVRDLLGRPAGLLELSLDARRRAR